MSYTFTEIERRMYMEIPHTEVLSNVVSYLENERDSTIIEANQTMEQNNDAAKIAIAKLMLIAEIIRMMENILQSNTGEEDYS